MWINILTLRVWSCRCSVSLAFAYGLDFLSQKGIYISLSFFSDTHVGARSPQPLLLKVKVKVTLEQAT
jgi:hypothetical protein